MAHLTVRVHESIRNRVKKEAEMRGISMQRLVDDAIMNYLNQGRGA
jgi:predicted DNA binding CopG/RHH family protein